jgi:hypothetical protein
MSRFSISMAAAALLAVLVGTEASALTFDLTLMSGASAAGSGSFTISGPIASTGFSNFTGNNLTSLNFVIDANSFQLANAVLPASVTFFNGNLVSIAYVGSLNGMQLSLDTLGLGYVFTDLANWKLDSAGTISVSATPLPSTFGMMLIGLGLLGFLGYRRTRKGNVLVPA